MSLIFSGVPGGDAADETAATNGNEQGVEVGALLLEFETDGSLTEQGLELVVGVNGHGAGLRDPGYAGGEGVGVAVADNDEVGATAADALDLFWGSDVGDKKSSRARPACLRRKRRRLHDCHRKPRLRRRLGLRA